MLAANRSPPMWEISQVSAGCEAVRAAATGRPRSAQQASCRPWVQTPKSGPSTRGQSWRLATRDGIEVESVTAPRAPRTWRRAAAGWRGKGEEDVELRATVRAMVPARQQHLDVLVGGQVGLDRVGQPAVLRGTGPPRSVVLDQQERGQVGGRPGKVVLPLLGGSGTAEVATAYRSQRTTSSRPSRISRRHSTSADCGSRPRSSGVNTSRVRALSTASAILAGTVRRRSPR